MMKHQFYRVRFGRDLQEIKENAHLFSLSEVRTIIDDQVRHYNSFSKLDIVLRPYEGVFRDLEFKVRASPQPAEREIPFRATAAIVVATEREESAIEQSDITRRHSTTFDLLTLPHLRLALSAARSSR